MTVTRNSVVNQLYTNFVFFFFAMERFNVHQISQTNQLIMHHNLSKRFQFEFIATNYSDINFSEEKQSQDLWEKIANIFSIYCTFILQTASLSQTEQRIETCMQNYATRLLIARQISIKQTTNTMFSVLGVQPDFF